MSLLQAVFLTTLIAGLAMPLGAAFARIEHIKARWLEEEFRHSVIAFGGGALLSTIALVQHDCVVIASSQCGVRIELESAEPWQDTKTGRPFGQASMSHCCRLWLMYCSAKNAQMPQK